MGATELFENLYIVSVLRKTEAITILGKTPRTAMVTGNDFPSQNDRFRQIPASMEPSSFQVLMHHLQQERREVKRAKKRSLLVELNQYLHDRQSRRTWSLAGQDGIIGTAGILLGFTGAGAGEATLVVAGTAATVAGMLTTGGAKWSETAAEREAQLKAIDEEKTELKQQPDVERIELIHYYERKGLTRHLATLVSDELMMRSPLKAALESEHGMLKLTSRAEVIFSGVGSSIAYALGAVIPFAIAYYLPVNIEIWVIVFSVLVSLSLISIVGAHAGHMDVSRTILRSIVVASVTIIVSYLVGQIAF